jgi:Condensation domain
LGRAPLIRYKLFHLSEDHGYVLTIVLHHIVADGWSVDRLQAEFAELYAAHVEQREPRLDPLSISYVDFALWQREHLAPGSDLVERQLRFWREQLQGAPDVLNLPTDRPRPKTMTHSGDSLLVELTSTVYDDLEVLRQESGATLYQVLMAVYAVLLHRYSGQDDIVIGSPIANRHRPEVESLVGMFVNTLALRVRLSSVSEQPATFADVLR